MHLLFIAERVEKSRSLDQDVFEVLDKMEVLQTAVKIVLKYSNQPVRLFLGNL